jgi:hypothetical protein
MARYDKLKHFLIAAKFTDLDMSFAQIEKVLGRALPPSAFKHRAWWSNNPENNVMTRAWIDAGYQTADVDMTAKTVSFVFGGQNVPAPVQFQAPKGLAEKPATGFIYDGVFEGMKTSLSPRAREWLDMVGKNENDSNRVVINVIESLAAKSLRRSIIDKYAKLNIGSGSDSVDLIREARDER